MSTVLEPTPVARPKQTRPFVLKGVMQAPVTPLHDDFSVDYDGLAKMVEFHVRNGAPAIAWPHHKAESPNLTMAERKRGAEVLIKTVAKRVPVSIFVGSLSERIRSTSRATRRKPARTCSSPSRPTAAGRHRKKSSIPSCASARIRICRCSRTTRRGVTVMASNSRASLRRA